MVARPAESELPGLSARTLLAGWLPWFPALLAAGFTIWLLGQFPRVIDVIHLNPDAAWAPVLVRDLDFGTRGGLIFVGEASHLTTIWFLALTRTLPFRDLIWDWAPYLTFLASLGLVAWGCRQVAGAWPAAMTFVLGATAEATVLLTVMAEGIRNHTFFANALLGAVLVLAAVRPELERWGKAFLVAVAIAVVGSTLASDPLFLAVGLAPFVGAPLVVWLLRRERWARALFLAALAVAALGLLLSGLIWRVMRSIGFRRNYLTEGYSFASPEQILANLKEFAGHVRVLGNGYATSGGIAGMLEPVMTLVIIGAAAYGFFLVWRLRRRLPDEGAAEGSALLLYVAFWLLSALGTLAAFALSSFAAGPSDSSRYVIPVFLALAALGPLWGRAAGWRRPVAAVGVALFCALSIASRDELFAYEQTPGFQTLHDQGDEIVAFLRDEGVRYGYGGYFTSHQLTLKSGLEVYSFPVIACRQPESDTMCPFSVNTRTAWYEPRRGQKSFVIHDAMAPALIAPAPPAALGPPSAARSFGAITVSVYDYDIASTFAPPCIGSASFLCPAR